MVGADAVPKKLGNSQSEHTLSCYTWIEYAGHDGWQQVFTTVSIDGVEYIRATNGMGNPIVNSAYSTASGTTTVVI